MKNQHYTKLIMSDNREQMEKNTATFKEHSDELIKLLGKRRKKEEAIISGVLKMFGLNVRNDDEVEVVVTSEEKKDQNCERFYRKVMRAIDECEEDTVTVYTDVPLYMEYVTPKLVELGYTDVDKCLNSITIKLF